MIKLSDFAKKLMHTVRGEPDKKEVKKPKTVHYQHQRVIEELLQAITDTPMDDMLKMVLRMRIWGKHPQVFSPMSYKGIAKLFIREGSFKHSDMDKAVEAVHRLEAEAKHYVGEHLKRVDMFSIGGRFETDNLIKTIVKPQ